jgi:hypothetical protein
MDHYFLTVICLGGPLCTIQRLTATCDAALCNFAFKFNSRHYTTGTSSSCCSATAPSWTTRQGLTLVHFSGERKRFRWNLGCVKGLRMGCSGGV